MDQRKAVRFGRRGLLSDELRREWLQLGVAMLPGTAFGPFPERVRLSLATRKEDVVEAARRLREHYAGPGVKGG